MPMVWNDEANARLFSAVLATTDIKIDLKAVAAIMGPECTPKALTHRITAIKKKAGALATNGDSIVPASSPATPNTPMSAKPANPRKRTMKSDATANGHVEDTGPAAKKARTNGSTPKGTKKSAPAAPDVVKGEDGKKVKHEDDEDDEDDDDDDNNNGDDNNNDDDDNSNNNGDDDNNDDNNDNDDAGA
ncbi:hypothetical protein PV04_06914 [Phialophora macrospora]|uniref:Uncharacterized protein n=1 Tax=Phialophora macrospora TaxID=1851006 RepID=A0A0D2DZW6_9EURO|nr:hypothetical protein PV04_06914 [Phialophora macrospora]